MDKAEDAFVKKMGRDIQPEDYGITMSLRKIKEGLDDAIQRQEELFRQLDRKDLNLAAKDEDSSIPLSQRLRNYNDRVEFDDRYEGVDPLTGLPLQKHDYYYKNGKKIKVSASGIIKQYPEYNLDYVDFLYDRIEGGGRNSTARQFFVEQTQISNKLGSNLITAYIKAIRLNDWNLFEQTLKDYKVDYTD
jgi:hypothetical protein